MQTGLWGRIRQFFGAPITLTGASLLTGAVKATQTLTSDTTATTSGSTLTIDTTVYTFRDTLSTGPTVPYEVLIGISAATSLDNLKSAINGSAGIGTTYSVGTIAHPTVTATTNTDTTQVVEAKVAGTAGNAIATNELPDGADHLAWGTTHLAGGTGTTDPINAPGNYFITCGSIDKPVLYTPVAGQDDGAIVTVISTTAFAHVVTTADAKVWGGGGEMDVLTFAAAVGAGFSLEAYQGLWYVRSLINVTLSDA